MDPWSHLEGLWVAYREAEDTFNWQAGVTPLTDLKLVVGVWVAYWSTILGLKWFMVGRQPFQLKWITALHNLILCVWSAVMMLWMAADIYRLSIRQDDGWKQVLCLTKKEAVDTSDRTLNAFWFHVYIYYISKFWELFDTVILVLKGKPVIFLHWYHHTIVIAMVWSWIEYRNVFCSLGMLLNTCVHVFMYYYYMCAILKWDVWFKRYITKMQIVQFISSFVLALGYLYLYAEQGCTGMESFLFSYACNASFLYLFIVFERRTYRTKKDPKKAQ